MDSRTAAHILGRIADHLDLRGENPFKVKAYRGASKALLAIATDDLGPMLRSGELARVRGLGPATLAVVRDLVEQGESRYLEELRAETPEGFLELARVPALSLQKIHLLHQELGISSVEELEEAARDGRLTRVKGMGPKTAQKILASIEFMRSARPLRLFVHAIGEAEALLAAVRSHPDVLRAELAGSLRRRVEVVGDVDIVAACRADPAAVAGSFARLPGLRTASADGASVRLEFMDGLPLDLHCVTEQEFGMAFLRATGSASHVERLGALLDARRGTAARDEAAVYLAAGLPWIPPELREGHGEIDAARSGTLPHLIEPADIRGALHCHTTYSDGKHSIAEMAEAARALGWSYLGISDHSQAAFYASGVAREAMLEQHDEIDALNATLRGIRVLKGVEADILADGRLDYDEALLDRFDYVIASIHSRFRMDGDAMTQRVLRAMDDPHMTILAHPTGRLLLSRAPYALDLDAVFEKAAATGVAIEINADPHRLDLDWRHVRRARELGVTFAIGPDAHSRNSLRWTDLGVAMARKGWLSRYDVLNTRDTGEILAFARRRRT